MNLQGWLDETNQAYSTCGNRMTPEIQSQLLSKVALPTEGLSNFDKTFLEQGLGSSLMYGASLTNERQHVAEQTADVMLRYFFKKATSGGIFGDLGRIKEKFGRTLEKNYPRMSVPFRQLAQAYWTFKIEVGDLFPRHHDKLIAQVLVATEGAIGSIFFPAPGPEGIDSEVLKYMEKDGWPSASEMRKLRPSVQGREKAMRETLSIYAPELNADEFVRNNPILFRERAHGYGKEKWPGYVIAIFCLAVMWIAPDDAWWGKIVYWGALIWLVLTVWYLLSLYTGKA